MAEVALQGAKELDAKLKALSGTMAPKLIRGALGEALKPTLALARASVPEGDRMHRTYKGRLVSPGFARRSTYISTTVARDGSSVSATIGVRDEAFYAIQFIEFGFKDVPARPWLVPAFNATRTIMLSLFVAALSRRIEAAARKGGA
jgi:hypothetical protein